MIHPQVISVYGYLIFNDSCPNDSFDPIHDNNIHVRKNYSTYFTKINEEKINIIELLYTLINSDI